MSITPMARVRQSGEKDRLDPIHLDECVEMIPNGAGFRIRSKSADALARLTERFEAVCTERDKWRDCYFVERKSHHDTIAGQARRWHDAWWFAAAIALVLFAVGYACGEAFGR